MSYCKECGAPAKIVKVIRQLQADSIGHKEAMKKVTAELRSARRDAKKFEAKTEARETHIRSLRFERKQYTKERKSLKKQIENLESALAASGVRLQYARDARKTLADRLDHINAISGAAK